MRKTTNKHRIELLAPARDARVACEAIVHGADAVYMGASRFGARAQAGNSVDDVGRVCDFAHQYGARVYATVNTIVYDHELSQVEQLIRDLYRVGIDAIIVQDMGILRLDLPPVALHASTQCDLRTPEKARFLEQVGFSQLVMARELTLEEISAIHQAVSVPLEGFVHGALCVCYSGRCQASQALKGRSANRGECAQLCRLPYDLEDAQGRILVKQKHLLSLRDFNLHGRLLPMLDAGVTSFKIEGRLKEEGYVKNVVAAYRQAFDAIIEQYPDRFERSSVGRSQIDFIPDLRKSFNRSFTTYFVEGHPLPNGHSMASIHTPKSLGEPLGRVVAIKGNVLRLDTQARLTNGDGLSYMGADHQFDGVRVNEVHGGDLVLNTPCNIAPGTMVYRTHDKAFADMLARPGARREITVDMSLRYVGGKLTLTLVDERGIKVTHTIKADLQPARQGQTVRQRQELGKLGGTIYRAGRQDVLDGLFVPASVLSQLRRDTVSLLVATTRLTYVRDRRRAENLDARCHTTTLESADNVANHLAEQFYRDHGVTHIVPAMETETTLPEKGRVVMHTRYCIRRELGCCLKDPEASRKMPRELYLRTGNTRLAIACDCTRCEMQLRLGL